jgi:hypothetical protein
MKVQCHRFRRTKDIWIRRSFGAGARAELNNESYFARWACQQVSVRRHRVEGSEEAQAPGKITDECVNRDHAIFFELADRDMNRPAIGADGTQAVIG